MTPKLDYVPRLDERNLAHLIETPEEDLTKQSVWWLGGPVLDQGQEGSCVGHGVVAEYIASPVRGRLGVPGSHKAELGHTLAVGVYERAKQIDEWEGVDYDGTSVRAGMLVAREKGWCTGFQWAKNLTQLRAGLQQGPVVLGISVTDGMWEPDRFGDWNPTGDEVGGHCLITNGYSPNFRRRGPRYRLLNSWGTDWGFHGAVYITPENLNTIVFESGGEAALPVGRHL